MRYCPDCGTPHECEVQAAGMRTDPNVEIARINADRDVTLAKLGARQAREELDTIETVAETQAEADIVSAVASAEIIASEEPAEPEAEPVVIDAPPVDMEPELDGEELAPVEGTPVPGPVQSSRRGLGMW